MNEKGVALERMRDEVLKALPWARLTVAGGNHQDPGMARLLPDHGFEGLWGFCWEQIEVDRITDRGCPWGLRHIDPDDRLRPGREPGLVALEWTARDLLKAHHSGDPTLYSTDPNDVARGGLCSWDHMDYWRGLAGQYLRNTRYNRRVWLVQHQEAHEMERSEHYRVYTEEDIRESALLLDGFVGHLREQSTPLAPVRFLSAPDAVAKYRAACPATEPSYMLWDDLPAPPPNREYAWNLCAGPWPRTFLYYDCDAQMVFVEGKAEPVCLRNYRRAWEKGRYYAEPELPRVRLDSDTRRHWAREIRLRVESPADMPFGVALWGDFSLYQPAASAGVLGAKVLAPHLLFVRTNVRAGGQDLVISLQGK
jgi:hypothetical protein